MTIYGPHKASLKAVMDGFARGIRAYSEKEKEKTGEMLYEHLSYRLKAEDSMKEKLTRKGFPLTAESAFYAVKDAIGFRLVCRFVDDIYENVSRLKALPGVVVVKEKDYIKNVKPNGYRSYHMILDVTAPYEDARGRDPGHFFIEIQLRTIAMDCWANIEHQLKYKQNIPDQALLLQELKRCADEITSTDLSLQTIRDLIEHHEEEPI